MENFESYFHILNWLSNLLIRKVFLFEVKGISVCTK